MSSPGVCVLPNQPANTRIETEVVTTNAGGISTGTIVAEPVSTVAGGATGGYDATSNDLGSESGPGSIFLDYQPTFNGNPITAPNQLTATMNFTTYFTLNAATTLAASCCTLSYGYSIDKDVSSSIVSLRRLLGARAGSGARMHAAASRRRCWLPTRASWGLAGR